MKWLLTFFAIILSACCHRAEAPQTPPRYHAVLEVAQYALEGDPITICTHHYLEKKYAWVERSEQQEPEVPGGMAPLTSETKSLVKGFYDSSEDTCYVVVKDVENTLKNGFNMPEFFTAIHEIAHKDDEHSGTRGGSWRWAYLRRFSPEDMTHADINAMYP